jgi:hypothetical protein
VKWLARLFGRRDEIQQGEAGLPPVPETDVVGAQARRLVEEGSATPRSSSEEGGD